jgi:phage protein D
MADSALSANVKVEIDGQELAVELVPQLERVVVDDYLHLPDMFVLVFHDTARTILQDAKLKIGSKVKIAGKGLDNPGPEPLINGEVTAIEAQYGPQGGRSIARGYDPSHRLHGGRRTETYRNVKDSDIAQAVAQRAGLKIGTIEDTRATYEHVSQANLSDWDFLKSRALLNGFEVAVEDGSFNFQKPTKSSEAPADGDFNTEDPTKLVLGQELLEFAPRVSSVGQVKEVKVRSWDAKDKRALVGSAQAGTTSAKLTDTPASLASIFGDPVHVTVDRPLPDQAAVDATAAALADEIGSTHAEAEGLARGNPKLKSGSPVSVGVVAANFEGKYVITQSRHEFDHRGYRTRFVVSGRQERSLLGLAGGNGTGAAGTAAHKIYGVVPAIVTGNNDPDKLGRVKLKFPWLSDDYESDWARMTQFGAGPHSGAVFLPEVNDEVLVAFEFGDIGRPFVIGALYNGKDKPKLGDGLFNNGKVKRRGVVSRRGHQLNFLDDPGKSGIALITGNNKLKIALNETGTTISVSSNGDVSIKAGGNVEIKSGQNIKLKADMNVDIESGTQLTLKGGTGVTVQAQAVAEVKGAIVKIN